MRVYCHNVRHDYSTAPHCQVSTTFAQLYFPQAREQLEEINENTRRTPDLDATVERLNQMIQQFEGLTNTPKKKGETTN